MACERLIFIKLMKFIMLAGTSIQWLSRWMLVSSVIQRLFSKKGQKINVFDFVGQEATPSTLWAAVHQKMNGLFFMFLKYFAFENVKTILSSKSIQKQVWGQICPTGHTVCHSCYRPPLSHDGPAWWLFWDLKDPWHLQDSLGAIQILNPTCFLSPLSWGQSASWVTHFLRINRVRFEDKKWKFPKDPFDNIAFAPKGPVFIVPRN